MKHKESPNLILISTMTLSLFLTGCFFEEDSKDNSESGSSDTEKLEDDTSSLDTNYTRDTNDDPGDTHSSDSETEETDPITFVPSEVSPMLANGSGFTLALKKDGSVWAWGNNNRGQLGNGTKENSSFPVRVEGLPSILDIAATSRGSYAVDLNGGLWLWGSSYDLHNTPIGDQDYTEPVKVPEIQGVISISAGKLHILALMDDGSVLSWGSGTYGKLGTGSDDHTYEPVKIEALPSIIAVSAGGEHSLALQGDGTVWGWGNNSEGQIGAGESIAASNIPLQIESLSSIVAITADNNTLSYALDSGGQVWGWGLNQNGNSFGLGTPTSLNQDVGTHYTPIMTAFNNVKSFITVSGSAIALKNDGTVWCAGFYSTSVGILPALIPSDHENIYSMPASNNLRVPIATQSPHFEQVELITKTWGQGPSHISFMLENGSVWSSGSNAYGQLGDGNTSSVYVREPVEALINLFE